MKDQIHKLKNRLVTKFSGKSEKKVSRTIHFIEGLYKDDKRKNGEQSIVHPLHTALKVCELGLGVNSVCAALLHDVLEDYDPKGLMSPKIKKNFGEDVLNMVNGLTTIHETSNTAEKSETNEIDAAQKYLLSTINDLRIIIIKLADKLHNLQTIEGLSPQRQISYMNEIERIYIPISEYMGLGIINRELQDCLFQKQHSNEYNKIKVFIQNNLHTKESHVQKIIDELNIICDIENIPVLVSGRIKSIASIHNKQQKYLNENKDHEIDNILDILAFRILTTEIADCYTTLSLAQKFYDTIENTLDDYIAKPKNNQYKSLHISLIHPEYGNFELQIKTEAMHNYNEFGPASHISYKQSGITESNADESFTWIKQIHSSSVGIGPDKPIKSNLFKNKIFVFTPQNDIIILPRNSTLIDFAYAIHTDLGNQCIGALVNKRPVALDTKLNTGDIVEIQTHTQKRHASRSWLDFVTTDKARDNIRRSALRKIHNI